MAKISLANILSGFSLTRINDNFQKIQDALNNQVLYRDNLSQEDNTVKQDIDMNGHKIYNLAPPAGDSHAARLKDVKNAIAGLGGYTANLIAFEPNSGIAATNVQGAIEEVGTFRQVGSALYRPVPDKLKDFVSVKDFGAKGDWVPSGSGNGSGTDDTAAFQAAFISARTYGQAVRIPAGNYRITASLDVSGINVVGEGPWRSFLYASSNEFDVITTTGNTILDSFGIDGGWDGATAGKQGCAVKVYAASPGWPYNVHIDSLRIINAKSDGILFDRGGYSSVMRCKINACGLHAIELKGYAAPNYCTTVNIGGMTTASDCPFGYGLMMTNAQHINCDGVISEYTRGIHASGNDNRAISLHSYYQEFTIGNYYFTTDGSGIGLTISGTMGGGHIVQESNNWYNVSFIGNSNLTESSSTFNGRVANSTGSETVLSASGDFTAASVTLTAGTWMVFGTLQTVNANNGVVSEAAIQLTTDNTQPGRNRTTNASFNFGSNDLVLNPGASGNLRVNTATIYQNNTSNDVTLYLRGYAGVTSGSIAYKGAIKAVKI